MATQRRNAQGVNVVVVSPIHSAYSLPTRNVTLHGDQYILRSAEQGKKKTKKKTFVSAPPLHTAHTEKKNVRSTQGWFRKENGVDRWP